MNKQLLLVVLIVGIAIGLTSFGGVFGQEEASDIPIAFTAQEVIIVAVGALGGLTTAYLGYRKAKNDDPKIVFDTTRFLDRIIMAVIPAVGFAIASSANLLEISAFSLYMVFTASLGTSELIMELRHRNTLKSNN